MISSPPESLTPLECCRQRLKHTYRRHNRVHASWFNASCLNSCKITPEQLAARIALKHLAIKTCQRRLLGVEATNKLATDSMVITLEPALGWFLTLCNPCLCGTFGPCFWDNHSGNRTLAFGLLTMLVSECLYPMFSARLPLATCNQRLLRYFVEPSLPICEPSDVHRNCCGFWREQKHNEIEIICF